jgi:hypothetical protein
LISVSPSSDLDWNGSVGTFGTLRPARREFDWENRWKKMAKRFLSSKSPTVLGSDARSYLVDYSISSNL